MASIDEHITRITDAKSEIRSAIIESSSNKISIPETDLIDTYADKIRAIPNAVLSGLNLDTQGGAGAYIQSIKQENGVISVTTGGVFSKETNIGLVPSFLETTGSDTKYLRADGTWATPPDTYYLYSVMSGATSEQDGTSGLVPLPSKNNYTLFLCGDGTWKTPDYLTFYDTRSITTLPSDYQSKFKFVGIKNATAVGLTTNLVGTYVSLIGWKGWTDNTGPSSWELASSSKQRLLVRDGNENWNNWKTLAYISDTFPSNLITIETNYTKAFSIADIASNDSLSTALGKLEYKADFAYDFIAATMSETSDDNTTIDRLKEVFDVLSGITDTDTINALVGKYLLLTGGTLTGTLTAQNIIPSATNNYSLGTDSVKWANVYATTFTGNLTGIASSADSLSSWAEASSTSTKRYIWMSYNDNSGKACYDAGLTYLTDTSTLWVSGNLEVGNTDANHTFALRGSSSLLKFFAWGDATYIESGNYNFSKNKPLKITGIGGATGSDLYLDFTNIYCRGTQSINIDSGNYLNYVKILANYFSERPGTCDYLYGDGSLRHFKATGTMTTSKPPSDAHVLHFAWDNDKGWESQLAISTSKTPTVYIRGQATKTWGDWITLLSSNNYTTYTVKKDGTGASGTWNISAKALARSNGNTTNDTATNDASCSTYSLGLTVQNVYNGSFPTSYGNVLTINSTNAAGGGGNLIFVDWGSVSSDPKVSGTVNMYIRGRRDNYTHWSGWTTVITDKNYKSILDNTYLQLSGGTLTGSLGLGQYGILGFGASIDSKYVNSAAITAKSTAIWLATTGGASEAAGIMIDEDRIQLWSPIDYPLVYIDSDNGTSYTILHSGNYTTCVNTTNFPGLHKTGTVTSVTLTQGTGITVSSSGTAITTSGSRTITLNAASTTAIGGIQLGYTATGANIPLLTSSNKGFVALTKSAVLSALGVTINTGTANRIAYYSGSTTISCNSNITIGTNSISCSGGFYETSDERLKDFYDDIKIDFEKLSKLPKKYFKWKQDQSRLNIGTSAQELQKLYPELVNTDDDGILHVAYDKLSIIALKGIDKLYDEIKKLKARIEYLELK